MAEESLVYIKFSNEEGVVAKENVLSSEIVLLKIAQAIRGYNFYRLKELEYKFLLYKKIKEVQTSIGQLQKILPKSKTPEILKKIENEEKEFSEFKKSKVKTYDISLEEQLREIEAKLNQLQSQGL